MNLKNILLGFIFLSSFSVSAEELFVVSSKKFANETLTLEQIKETFLGVQQTNRIGTEIQALDRKTCPDDCRAKFYRSAISMSASQLKSYWSQRIFTGRGYPPAFAEDLAALKKVLKENANAISFVLPSELDDSLKVLYRVEIK